MAVLVDSSVWITSFRSAKAASTNTLAQLIDQGNVVVAGPVIAEVLEGLRSFEKRNEILKRFEDFQYLETTYDIWRNAGQLAAALSSKGQRIPLSDVLLAALAIENDAYVYTTDKHFARIPGLKLYSKI